MTSDIFKVYHENPLAGGCTLCSVLCPACMFTIAPEPVSLCQNCTGDIETRQGKVSGVGVWKCHRIKYVIP